MINLDTGLKGEGYWREVCQTADDRLKESGFEDWVVTVRRRAGAHDDEVKVDVRVASRLLEIDVYERPELPPESFVQTSVIDVIEKALGVRRPAVVEDPLVDEGGEA